MKEKYQLNNRPDGKSKLMMILAIAGFMLLFLLGGAFAGMAMANHEKRKGEAEMRSNAAQYGIFGDSSIILGDPPSSSVSMELDGMVFTMPDKGRGRITHESHLLTDKDPSSVSSTKDRITEHLDNTNFSTNCPSDIDICSSSKQQWTPAEGGGNIGEGSRGKVPAELEPWVMNAAWYVDGKRKNPPKGTRVIITAIKTGRSIVAVAGYEWGPSTNHVAGAQVEILANLGIKYNDEVKVGFAEDQNLVPGTVYSENESDRPSVGTSSNDTSVNMGPEISGEFYPPLGNRQDNIIRYNNTPHTTPGHYPFKTGSFKSSFRNVGDPAIDFNITNGKNYPVYACFDGFVSRAKKLHKLSGSGKKAGGVVWFESHDGKYGAIYAHIEFVSGLKAGSEFKKGQQIGKIARHCGTRGSTSQCVQFNGYDHLHFQLYTNKKSYTKTQLMRMFPK